MSNFSQKKLFSRPSTERSKNRVTIPPPPPINTYIWGAGNFGKAAIKVFEQSEQKISGIIDSDTTLQGKEKYGYKVFAPREILILPKESLRIVIAVKENEEIISALKTFGFNFTTIFNFIPSSIEDFQKKFPNMQIEKIPNAFSSKLFLIKNANLMSIRSNLNETDLIHFDRNFVFDNFVFGRLNNSDFPRNNSNEIRLHSACNMSSYTLHNYWHFTDFLPRVIALESVGFKGVYITNGSTHKYLDEILNLLGIPNSRIIHKEPDTRYIVENFYTSDVDESFLTNIGKYGKFFESLREKVFHNIKNINESKYPKRIYVSRIGIRKISNEKEVLKMLKKYKFKIIVPENLSVAEQIKYFHNAETVVCPHGANSTNIVYMNPHSNFLEIFPAHHVNPCMFGAIDYLKLNYRMFVTRSTFGNVSKNGKDFNVNVGHLEVMLKTVIG